MFCLHSKGFLLFYIIAVCENYRVQCEYNYKQTINPLMKQTIMQDMQHAFCTITNNTHILRKMYDFETANSDISTLLFELPNNDKNPKSKTLVLMNRREFMSPTFPNLTKSYMTLRRLKISKTPITENIATNLRELLKREMLSFTQDNENDAWSDMGLDGWKGDITDSRIPTNHKYSQIIANDYPYNEITMDLNKELNEYFQNINSNTFIEKEEDVEAREEMDNNVFIARVNDPFGYSTKWEMRNSSQSRGKRDALNLYSMIKCSTGCEPFIYKGYGCFCGFLGSGIPIDGIDRCCKIHDKCYDNSNCIPFLQYFVPYVWKCYRGKPVCAIDHGQWGGTHSCAANLCLCDLELSRCLRQYACPTRRAVCRSSTSRQLQNLLLQK